ncbi:hypothetical protein RJ639_045392, partial [Escallonia herrerae]
RSMKRNSSWQTMQPTFFFILTVQVCTLVTCSGECITKFPAILIFGDSTVDAGNNNYILLLKATIAHMARTFPVTFRPEGFLMANSSQTSWPLRLGSRRQCLHSCSQIYGMTNYVQVSALHPQPRYLGSYIERLWRIVGEEEAQRIVSGALVVVTAGTNDLIYNFYDIPTRKPFFTIEAYQDFLQDKIQNFTKELYSLGCRTIVVSGLPPIRCLPIQMTTKSILRNCVRSQNYDSQHYNDKLVKVLSRLQASLPGSRILYFKIYTPLMDMINNPGKYGFLETGRGCCGTGLVEAGPLCTPFTSVCANRSQYLVFDSIHPGESAYHIVTEYLKREILRNSKHNGETFKEMESGEVENR